MERETFTVGKFAKLTGVTERTLRYYDRRGLLRPEYSEQGHRLYTENDLFQLQKILTLKYLGFTLEDIYEYLQKPGEDLEESLAVQTQLLQQKRDHLDQVLAAIEQVQGILRNRNKEIDSDTLLMLIYVVHHEKSQKQSVANHMSQALQDRMLMKGKTAEEKMVFETSITSIFTDMIRFYDEGRSADDDKVQEKGLELMDLLTEVFKPEELDELKDISDRMKGDAFPFTKVLKNDVEAYLSDVLMKINKI